jgi:diguanylate cyclase (GGDEF)-like protein/PAS domain S-box-containing protein
VGSMRAVAVAVGSAAQAEVQTGAEARSWHAHVWIWYLAFTGGLAGLYLFAPPLAGNGPLINAIGLSSPIAIAIGIRIHKPRAVGAWWLFAIGQFLFFMGDLYTYSYPKLFGVDVPFPSLGDAVYLTVYPALMIGLVILVRRRNPQRDRTALVDSMILTIGVALLSWVFLVAPNIHLSGLSVLAKAVSAAYPLGDVLLLAAAIRLAVDVGKRVPAFYMLVASIVCLLATDSAYGLALLQNTFHHQLSYDAGWIAYYILWGAAALHPSMRELEQAPAATRPRLTRLRLGLLGGACLIAPGIRFVQAFHSPDELVIIVAAALLFLLVVARMAGLVRQEEQAAARESALRRAGASLVAAAGKAQVYDASIAAVRSLVGHEAHVLLTEPSDGGAVVVAATASDAPWELDEATQDELRRAADAHRPCDLAAAARSELRLAHDTVLALRLGSQDEERGMLLASVPDGTPVELLASLESLAAQISLAVDGASLAEDLHRRQSEARFRSLVAHSTDLITVLDANGRVMYQSPSIERVLGYRVDEVEGTDFSALVGETDRPRLAQVVAGVGSGNLEAHTIQCSLIHRDGRPLQFEVQHTDLLHDEHVQGIVLNARDVSERKAFETQLAHQAFHDPVTNLANRALFSDRLQHALTRAQRTGSIVAVMFIDLDDFKTVNDSLGHPAGDVVLRDVAERLTETIRPTDTVARFGGDEFAVLLDGVTDSQDAADAAVRIVRAIERQIELDGKQVFPRCSIGICLARAGTLASDAEELLRNADVAMYMAKRDNKGSYRVFEPKMHERVLERLELRADLHQAVKSNQLEVHYQPVVRLHENDVYGVEALLRWMHPTRGPMLPDQFIPLAEETGLIIPIGRWVLNVACRDGAILHERFPGNKPLAMSVNLSVRQLQSDTIVSDVREALESSGFPPESLVLEITESVMLADTDLAVRRLHQLKELGVRLAMDDFGTGYSSLSYLGKFPVDILKMDRSFLASRNNDSLAAAIIALGENLTLEVVAEGVEQPEQALWLQDVGCELGQGFHFARPMTDGALLDYLVAGEQDGWGRSGLGTASNYDAA